MEKSELQKRIRRIIFLIFFLLFISFLWWGPYQEYFRIKESLMEKKVFLSVKL